MGVLGAASPRTGSAGPGMMSQSELWDSLRNAQLGQKRIQEALHGQGMLTPAVLAKVFPLTWARSQAGSGARFAGAYAVGIGEGHTVDIKACMLEPPTTASAAAAASAVSSSSSSSSGASSSRSPSAEQDQEHEEGEAEEDPLPREANDEDVYRDHDGARWCWPFTSGDSVAHVAGFGKSLIWELARAEVNSSGAPYRGAEGINTIY